MEKHDRHFGMTRAAVGEMEKATRHLHAPPDRPMPDLGAPCHMPAENRAGGQNRYCGGSCASCDYRHLLLRVSSACIPLTVCQTDRAESWFHGAIETAARTIDSRSFGIELDEAIPAFKLGLYRHGELPPDLGVRPDSGLPDYDLTGAVLALPFRRP